MHPRMIEKKTFYEDCLWKKNMPQARLIKQDAPQAGFLD